MIESQRISKYSRTDESMIPAIDSFRIGDYRTINTGYRYIIRNNGKDSFKIGGKQKIRAAEHLKGENSHVVGQFDTGNNSTAERTGSGLGYNRDGNLVSADGGALQENDRYLEENGTPEQRISPYEDSSNSGRGYLKNSLRNTEGASNRPLPANALESAAQNDIERRLYDLRAQIREMSSDKNPRFESRLFYRKRSCSKMEILRSSFITGERKKKAADFKGMLKTTATKTGAHRQSACS